MASRLNPEQVEFFKTEGYLLFDEPVFHPDKFAALQEHFEALVKAWEAQGGRPEHMDVPHFSDVSLFNWLFDDDVLDIVEGITGPDIALWSSHFICKPPKAGKRVPWHEDSAYWGERLDPMDVITIWLAIDPSTTENGCMRVIPRTHVNGYSEYSPVEDLDKQVFNREINPDQFDESKAVDCILKPNTCSIHHAKLIHGSHANTGVMRRCGYTMRYMPSECHHTDEGNTGFQIYLARGKDNGNNTYGDPTQPNEAFLEKRPSQRMPVGV